MLALIGIVILFVVKKKKKQSGEVKEINYQSFFTMGIIFVALGVVFSATINPGFIGFIGLGIVYMIIGWKNKDKTQKNKETSKL